MRSTIVEFSISILLFFLIFFLFSKKLDLNNFYFLTNSIPFVSVFLFLFVINVVYTFITALTIIKFKKMREKSYMLVYSIVIGILLSSIFWLIHHVNSYNDFFKLGLSSLGYFLFQTLYLISIFLISGLFYYSSRETKV